MSIIELNFVSRIITLFRLLVDQYGEIVTLDALGNGAANLDAGISDADLETVASFAHLTQNDLVEALYIIGNLKALMSDRLQPIAALTQEAGTG